MYENKLYKTNPIFIDEINRKQSGWRAKAYDFLNSMTISDLVKMAGGKKSKIYGAKPKPAPISDETRQTASELPSAFGTIFDYW